MTALYTLTKELNELAAMADTDDEGLRQAIQDTMAGIAGEFEDKADSIVRLIRNIESDVAAIDVEMNRLKELKRIKSNSVGEMEDYLRRNMDAAGKKTIKRPLFTITVSAGRESVIVDKEDDLPDDLTAVSTSIVPKKNEIAKKLKEIREHNIAVQARIDAGEDCADELIEPPTWAHLERGDSSIKIK